MTPDDHNPYARYIVEQREISGVVIVCLSAAIGLVVLLFALLIR